MTLLHDPDVLLIDELSLGLAPIVVQELLDVVERLKARGHDDRHRRAVAQRRARRSPTAPCSSRRARCASRVRPPSCAERDDLARAVFLGARGRLIAMLAALVTRQLARSTGSSPGLVYGLLAMGIVLVYRATAGHQLRGRQHGPGRRRPARRCWPCSTTCPYWLGRRRRARRRHALRRDHRAHRHPPAVRRATRDRARRHHRHRPALAGHPDRLPGASTSAAPRFPPADRLRRTTIGGVRVTGAQLSILIVVPLVAVAARLVPQPHHLRQERQGVGREPRPGPAQRHQPEARVDCSCGPSPARWPRCRSSLMARPDGLGHATSPCSARARWSAPWPPR